MKTLVVHLSDLHFSVADQGAEIRGRMIADAATSDLMSVGAVHLVCTGDIMNRGDVRGLVPARLFFNAIRDRLRERTGIEPALILAPGNHDCDFSGDQSVRDLVVTHLRAGFKDPADAMVQQAASVLGEFFKFQAELGSEMSHPSRWHSVFEAEALRYVILNSPVLSTKQEAPGSLFMPLPKVVPAASTKSSRTIYVMHHPFNWLHSDNARELALFSAANADIFLMGHEHVSRAQASKELYDGNSITYLKGHVLKEEGNRENSAFQTILIDDDAGYLLTSYRWAGSRYVRWDDHSLADYCAWPKKSGCGAMGFLDDAYQELTSAGANFTHRKKAVVTLPDIYVWPVLRSAASDPANGRGTQLAKDDFCAELLADDREANKGFVVIRGAELSGKSSLAKMLALRLSQRSVHAVLLSSDSISSWRLPNLNARIDAAIESTYGKTRLDEYKQLDPSQKVLIIDDFDVSNAARGTHDAMHALRSRFGTVFIMMDSFPGIEMLVAEFLGHEHLADAQVYDIQEFSYENRLELIERWLAVGGSDADPELIRAAAARSSKVVDETLGRNLIPALPVFVLIILQRLELAYDLDTLAKGGSQGFLYEGLIYQAINSKVSEASIQTCVRYLSEFAVALNSRQEGYLTQADFEKFHVDHCRRFAVQPRLSSLQDQLGAAGILASYNGRVSFRYPYHEYYFQAKSLANTEGWASLEPEVDRLVESIHTERSANILLFLAHVRRDSRIAQKLVQRAKGMFPGFNACNLFDSDGGVQVFDSAKVRAVLLDGSRSDQLRAYQEEASEGDRSTDVMRGVAEARLKDRMNDALSMNAAFKLLQVLGQFLRNHAGDIEAEQKVDYMQACVDLGLKTLSFMLGTAAEHGEDLLEYRAAQLKAEKPGLSQLELQDELQRYMPMLAATFTTGTLIKLANAIGAEELAPTHRSLLDRDATGRLVRLATQLEHFSEFPAEDLREFHDSDLRSAPFLPNNVMRRFIVRRLYLFPAREELKRAILDRFKIKALPFKFLEQRRPD